MDQLNQAIHNGGNNLSDQQQHMDILNGLQVPNQQQLQSNNYPNYMPPPGAQHYWPMAHNELPSTSTAANYARMGLTNGGGRTMPPFQNPHYFPSPEQMNNQSMPGAVSSPSVSSSSALEFQGNMPGGPGGSPLKNGVPFSPSGCGYNQMVNGGNRNAFVFSTEMANRAASEVVGKRYDSMVHWHMDNAGAGGVPSTSAAAGMPCRSPLEATYGGVGSPGGGGLSCVTNGRGTKRKGSAPMNNPDQQLQQTPSPHLPAMSSGKAMQHLGDNSPSSVPDAAMLAAAAISTNKLNGMAPYSSASDFLRPSDALSMGQYTPSQEDDNPLKKIEAMTKLCDSTPNPSNGNKMSRIALSNDLPTAEAAAAQSKEQKLAKLEAINKFMNTTPEFGNQANTGIRRPPFFLPPGMHASGGGMPTNQPPFDPQLAAMLHPRQPAAFYGPAPPNGMAWNGGPAGPQMLMGLNGPVPASSHSPSFNSVNQPNPMLMTGGITNPQQSQFPGAGGQGMGGRGPGPGQMFPVHMAAMQQHIRMAQPDQQPAGFQPDMRAAPETGYWPPQHHMPQPLANLDARVPVQKMQYFPNSQMGQPQQSMTSTIPQ